MNEKEPRWEPIDRRQVVLEPLDVEKLIPEEHPARNVWEILGRLDLSRFAEGIKSVAGHAGRNAWEPRLLIAMWLYAYSRGISSAREIERQCEHEPGLRWLTGLKVVNHHTLSDFRVEHGEALQELFVQVLGLLSMEKLITLERVTVDGTKVRARVNKKTFSRAAKIRAHMAAARQQVEQLQREEAEEQKGARQAAARRRALRERAERLEEAAREVERLQAGKKWERDKPCQASTTDADAQFMRTSDHGLAPAYNVQVVTDARHKLIVDVEVSQQPSDSAHLLPALDRVKQRLGAYPNEAVADGDYTTREAIVGAAERGVNYYGSFREGVAPPLIRGIHADYQPRAFQHDALRDELICPEGRRLGRRTVKRRPGGGQLHVYAARREDCQSCSKRPRCTPQNTMPKYGRTVSVQIEGEAVALYREKMNTGEAKAIYRQRAPVAEFPNAWLKDKLRWVRLRCRGLVKAQAEALWAALTYNLQRYFKLAKLQTA